MAEHLVLMAAHVRHVVTGRGSEAVAGATILQARAHLDEPAWRRWVEREVQIPLDRARELMAVAEQVGASVETLRPRELGTN
ncbi:MAG: hypothetical protein ABMA64_36385 [Myxococcota bacterium]